MVTGAPIVRNALLDLTPIEVAGRCRHLNDLVFFDTSLETGAAGEISIIAANPECVIAGRTDADWVVLQTALAARQSEKLCDDAVPRGFAAGFVEYDGSFRFGFYDNALIHRHADQSWIEIGDLLSQMRGPRPAPRITRPHFTPTLSRERFCGMIARALEYIAAGDIYQVNLAHRFTAEWRGDAFAFYEALRHYSPAPHAAVCRLISRRCRCPATVRQRSSHRIPDRPDADHVHTVRGRRRTAFLLHAPSQRPVSARVPS